MKPYMYQVHLWQILNVIIAQKFKFKAPEASRHELAKRLVGNVFFSFKMQYKRVWTSQANQKQNKEKSRLRIKEMNQGLDVSINGIGEYLCICLGGQSFGREKLRELFNLTLGLLLDLLGEFRASKNLEMVQYMAQITIGICNNLSGGSTSSAVVDEVISSLAFPNQNDGTKLTSNAAGGAQPNSELREATSTAAVGNSTTSAEASAQNKADTQTQKAQNKKAPLSAAQLQQHERQR